MSVSKWLESMRTNDTKKAMPILSFPGIQDLGMTVKEMIMEPENQVKCMKVIADRFDTAAAVSLMDLSVEAEAFGSTIKFSDDEVPTVIGSIVSSEEDAENLKVPNVGDARTGVCVEAIRLAAKEITDRPILAGVIGPFSLAGRLMDMTEIMVNCLVEPDMTHSVLEKTTEFITKYIAAMKEAGANGVVIAEPAAGLLSPDICEEFSSVYVRKLIQPFKDDDFIIVYHNCGNTVPLIDSISSIGADIYHFGDAIDIKTILEKMPSDLLVSGNLSPVAYFKDGTPESVAEATRKMLSDTKGYKNYIPSSGCDIPPLAPMANIEAFFAEIKANA